MYAATVPAPRSRMPAWLLSLCLASCLGVVRGQLLSGGAGAGSSATRRAGTEDGGSALKASCQAAANSSTPTAVGESGSEWGLLLRPHTAPALTEAALDELWARMHALWRPHMNNDDDFEDDDVDFEGNRNDGDFLNSFLVAAGLRRACVWDLLIDDEEKQLVSAMGLVFPGIAILRDVESGAAHGLYRSDMPDVVAVAARFKNPWLKSRSEDIARSLVASRALPRVNAYCSITLTRMASWGPRCAASMGLPYAPRSAALRASRSACVQRC